jgi:putative transposase
LIELQTAPAHVHLLGEIVPKCEIHGLVNATKRRSSGLLRQRLAWPLSRLPTLSTKSYFVATVGGAPQSVTKHYLQNEKPAD